MTLRGPPHSGNRGFHVLSRIFLPPSPDIQPVFDFWSSDVIALFNNASFVGLYPEKAQQGILFSFVLVGTSRPLPLGRI